MNAGQVAFFPWAWTADYPDALTYLGDMWYGSNLGAARPTPIQASAARMTPISS
jgi:hypothetical protein